MLVVPITTDVAFVLDELILLIEEDDETLFVVADGNDDEQSRLDDFKFDEDITDFASPDVGFVFVGGDSTEEVTALASIVGEHLSPSLCRSMSASRSMIRSPILMSHSL